MVLPLYSAQFPVFLEGMGLVNVSSIFRMMRVYIAVVP